MSSFETAPNIHVDISTSGSDAIAADPGAEVARILRAAADKIAYGRNFDFALLDINGNTVGHVTFT